MSSLFFFFRFLIRFFFIFSYRFMILLQMLWIFIIFCCTCGCCWISFPHNSLQKIQSLCFVDSFYFQSKLQSKPNTTQQEMLKIQSLTLCDWLLSHEGSQIEAEATNEEKKQNWRRSKNCIQIFYGLLGKKKEAEEEWINEWMPEYK